MIRPISAGQACVGNRGAGIGRVDKLSVSGIDANVGDGAAVSGEENNIPGKKVCFADVCTVGILGFGCTVRGVAQGFQNIIHKTRTVKAGGRGAAVYIGSTEKR